MCGVGQSNLRAFDDSGCACRHFKWGAVHMVGIWYHSFGVMRNVVWCKFILWVEAAVYNSGYYLHPWDCLNYNYMAGIRNRSSSTVTSKWLNNLLRLGQFMKVDPMLLVNYSIDRQARRLSVPQGVAANEFVLAFELRWCRKYILPGYMPLALNRIESIGTHSSTPYTAYCQMYFRALPITSSGRSR
jgi:hypothetical protein